MIKLGATINALGGVRPSIVLDLEHGPVVIPCTEADCRALGGMLGERATLVILPERHGLPMETGTAEEAERLRELHRQMLADHGPTGARLEIVSGEGRWQVIATAATGNPQIEVALAEAAIHALRQALGIEGDPDPTPNTIDAADEVMDAACEAAGRVGL